MSSFWSCALLALLTRIVTVHSIVDGNCSSGYYTLLVYVDNDNQFYKMMLDSRSEKSRIDVTFQNAGKVISMSSRGSSYNRIAFVEDRHSNRLSEFYYRNSMMHKVWHSELTDRIKEFVFTSVTYQNYLITEDNKIKLCCNRRMTLVKAPSGEEYKSLVLNAKRGSMYWISETSSEGKVMASSMDGKNVRKIYSSPKLHSIAYDDKVNKLYIAEVDAIMSLDLANNQVLTGITAKATRLSYANCALYFNDVSTNSIMVYKATTGLKKLVDVTNPDLPFIAAHENFVFTASPCSYAECTEYCLLSEGESEAIPRCVCPDCSNESGYGELEEKLDYIENDNTWNWSSIILAILFLFTVSALVLEVRSGNVSVWCQWIVKRLDLRSSDDTLFQMPFSMRAFLATFLIFCQFLDVKSQENWSCRNEKPILYYVENQNQIIAYNVSTGRSRMLNRKMDGVGKIVDLMGHFIDNETALFTVVDDENPHRITHLNTRKDKTYWAEHTDFYDSVKETIATKGYIRTFILTKGNDIKFCCNPNAILVHAQPDTEYRNLILDDKRGRFLWIAETSSEGKVMVSGTDGKNIRDVYTAEKIYSIGYDVDKQQVYVATEDNIKLVNVKSKQQNVVIQAKASQVFYYNCSFYFKDRKSGAISMYTSDRRTKQLVRKTDPELPFTVSYEKEYFEFSDICQTITCAKYCVYGESENGKIPRCIDPEDLIDLDNSDCSTFSWLTILFFIIALVFFILLVLELTSSVISNCCNRVKQINNPDQTTVQE